MKKEFLCAGIDVLILCGGLGKRLRPVIADKPKALAEVGGRPFLDRCLDYLVASGFRRFILCTGYKGNLIKQYYSLMPKSRAADILFSHEKKPRGTAGAIKHTAEAIKSNPFLVLNGDTFLRVDYSKFISFHLKKRALLSLVLTSCAKMSDSGSVAIREDGRVRDFREKVKNKPGLRLSNAGIYLLDKRILSFIPAGKKSSLEYEVLPEILNQRVFGFISKDKFLDIGTPKNYRLAQILLSGRVFAGGKGKK